MSSKSLLIVLVVGMGCSPAPLGVSSRNPTNTTPQGSHGGSGSKTYECKSQSGCTVHVNGRSQHYGYGVGVPVVCGAGVVVLGCGCGYDVPASCSCGETFEPSPSCAPASCAPSSGPPSCSAASCGSGPSCGSACGTDSPPPDRDH